jgi:hypothetical protein
MAMSQQELDKIKELFSTIGRTGALDFQRRAAAKLRSLARTAGAATNGKGYAALMAGADEIEHMEAVEASK